MRTLRVLIARCRGLFAADHADRDAREELDAHLDLAAREYVARGMPPADAWQRARQELGGVTNGVESIRAQRTIPLIENLVRDTAYAWRALMRNRSFTIAAVSTLAIGIGANSAIYSVVDGVLFRPLPYAAPERLFSIHSVMQDRRTAVSAPDYIDWSAQATSFAGIAAGYTAQVILTGVGEPERLRVSAVSANALEVLSLPPLIGRNFTADEDRAGASRVTLLGEEMWRSRFGGDHAVVGRTLILNGHPTQVIGVVSADMRWPAKADLVMPTRFGERDLAQTARGARWLEVVGRVRDTVPVAQARAELRTIAQRLETFDPQHNTGVGIEAQPLLDAMTGGVRTPLLILLGAAGFVLLIACANVGSLTLGRIAARESELALRTALGASRGRVVSQVLTESVVLALLGGAMGLLLGWGGVRALVAIAPGNLPRLDTIGVDMRVVGFTFVVTLSTAILFGIVPAMRGATTRLSERLRAASMGRSASARSRRTLVVVEVALALVLLSGAGLLTRSLARLQSVDPGFDPRGVSTFQLSLPTSRYATLEQQRQLISTVLESVGRIPGVAAAGVSFALPLSGESFGFTFEVRGAPAPEPTNEPRAQARIASPDYFRAMGIPLVRGRTFDERDRVGAPQTLVISSEVARRYFPDTDPIGKYLETGWSSGGVTFGGEVIGVVGDVRQHALDQQASTHMYMSADQLPFDEFNVVVRASMSSDQLLGMLRTMVRELDADVAMNDAGPLSHLVEASLGSRQFYLTLLGGFAAVALSLALVGTYGVIAYGVQLRRRELGIRLALGATSQRVMMMVLSEGLTLAVVGVLLGLGASLLLTRTLQSLLFEVGARDPLTLACAATAVAGVAVVASLAPARQAARQSAVEAMRKE